MLYKFKSKNAGDLIMLEPHGRRILEVIGKDTGATGIILPEQMPAAIEKETQGQVLNSYFRRARSWGWIRAITRVMRVTRHEGPRVMRVRSPNLHFQR